MQRKKPLYKIWWFWVILGIISFIFFGIVGACSDDMVTDNETVSSLSSTVSTEETTKKTATSVIKTEITTTAEIIVTEENTTEMQEQAEKVETETTETEVVETEDIDNDGGSEEKEIPVVDEKTSGRDYVLNYNTYKFHYPSCSSAKKIKPENRGDYYGTREELIDSGFSPCGICHP